MPAEPNRRIVWLLRLAVVLLAVQFLLGIWVNLFGTFPSTQDVATAARYTGDPVLTGHYALAIVLVVVGIVLVVVTFREGVRPSLRWLTVAGLLSVLWASASGVELIRSGFSSNTDSFSMAVAFIVATSLYGVAQALVLPSQPPPTTPWRNGETTATGP